MLIIIRRKRLSIIAGLLIMHAIFMYTSARVYKAYSISTINTEYSTILSRIYSLRAETLVSHNPNILRPYYDQSSKTSQYAYRHEETRCNYLKAWEKAREVEFGSSESNVRVTKVTDAGDKRLVRLRQTLFIEYTYLGDEKKTINRFAIDTLHALTIQKRGERWVILKEWYLDPLKEDTVIPDVMPVKGHYVSTGMSTPKPVSQGRYDRGKAKAYAMRYSGVALTKEGKHYYNLDYRSYNGLGGDCTNFASQVLRAGGVPMGNGWAYYRGAGSKAWVHTDTFANWLAYSGVGERIARETYANVAAPTDKYPLGAIQALNPGDLIGYVEKGDLVHFAVVVGRDSAGSILVNTHTADRYRVPWDLGWDKSTIYCLYRIRY